MKKDLFSEYKVQLLCVCLFLTFTFLLYAPYEMYLTNSGEFWFNLSMFWWMPIVGMIVALLVLLCAGYLFRNIKLYLVEIFALGLCIYIQGNFLNIKLGQMNGASIEWSDYYARMGIDVIVWALIIVGVVWLRNNKRFHKIISYISILLILMQMVSLVSLLIPVIKNPKETSSIQTIHSTDHLYEVGDENLIVFIVDMFDDSYMKNILNNYRSKLGDGLEGFTYFSNHVGSYSTTAISTSLIYTGHYYKNEKPFLDWVEDQNNSRLWMDEVIDAGYDFDIYEPCALSSMPDKYEAIANNYRVGKLHFSSNIAFYKRLTKLVMCKWFPNCVKPFVWMDSNAFDFLNEQFVLSNSMFRDGIIGNGISKVDGKKFKIIHIDGAHFPYYIDVNGDDLNYTIDNGDGTEAAMGTLSILKKYFDGMKANGTYDNADIIVMGDHGYYWAGVLTNPVLMIKRKGDTGELKINKAPVSHQDFGATMVDIIRKSNDTMTISEETLCDGISVFDVPENAERDRYFYQYYLDDYNNEGGQYRLIEYQVDSEDNKLENFHITDKEYTILGDVISHKDYCDTCLSGELNWSEDLFPKLRHWPTKDNPSYKYMDYYKSSTN